MSKYTYTYCSFNSHRRSNFARPAEVFAFEKLLNYSYCTRTCTCTVVVHVHVRVLIYLLFLKVIIPWLYVYT
jgi:hypothetical protein